GHGNDAVRGAFGGSIPDYEQVVVIVRQLVSSGEPLTQRFAHRPNQSLVPRLELADEDRKLLLGIGRFWSNCPHGFHGHSSQPVIRAAWHKSSWDARALL